jgi:uncharacterized protein (DUF433 family)
MGMSETEFWKDCSDVQIDPEKLSGEPTVGGYRLAARTVVDYAESGSTAEEIVEYFPGTPLDKVEGVLAYYYSHQPQLTPSH